MDQDIGRSMKVEIPRPEIDHTISPRSSSSQGLTRQASGKGSNNHGQCLCSPTTHAGSFRCRLHRNPTLHRTRSLDHPAPTKPDDNTNNTHNNHHLNSTCSPSNVIQAL